MLKELSHPHMHLRYGTIVSNMLRSSSSNEEIRGQEGGESNPNLVNVSTTGTNHSPNGLSAMNNNSGA